MVFDGWTIENILKAIALGGGVGAFLVGLWQYRRSQQWKRAEWVAQEMKELLGDPVVQAALQMIDWGSRRVLLFPHRECFEDRFVEVTDDAVQRALIHHEVHGPFTDQEIAIRDAFDRLLDGFERLESYAATGLVSDSDIYPYLSYWAVEITRAKSGDPNADRVVQLRQYMRDYGFLGADRLLCRLALK